MAAGFPLAIMLFAQAASSAAAEPASAGTQAYGPEASAAPNKPAPPKTAEDGCAKSAQSTNERQIVICAQRPNGYRLNPDVMEAKRELRSGGPPRPSEKFRDNSCASVGPAGCMNAGINLIGAALTAAEMAKRLAEGKEIGSMFITDPTPDEYHLYLDAKRRREEKEAQAALDAKVKAQAVSDAPAAAAQPAGQ